MLSRVGLQGRWPSRRSSFTTIQTPRPPNTVTLGPRLSTQTGHSLPSHPRRGQPFAPPPSLSLSIQRPSAPLPFPGLPRTSSAAPVPALIRAQHSGLFLLLTGQHLSLHSSSSPELASVTRVCVSHGNNARCPWGPGKYRKGATRLRGGSLVLQFEGNARKILH